MHTVVLGGGSSGEHFVGALRRLDAETQPVLVESRLIGGESAPLGLSATNTLLRRWSRPLTPGLEIGRGDPCSRRSSSTSISAETAHPRRWATRSRMR